MGKEKDYCGSCESAFCYFEGLKGKNSGLTKIMFVANRSDSRALSPEWGSSYMTALLASKTGKILTEILAYSCLSFEDIFLTNVYKCLLPDDREPRAQEYKNCRTVLEAQIAEFSPKKIVTLGQKAYCQLFPEESLKVLHRDAVGQMMSYHDTPTLVFLHPREVWYLPREEKNEKYSQIADFLRD